MDASTRLVVCTVLGDRDLMELPDSRVGQDRATISGGERSMYELAVAGAALGLDVELRGLINGPILAELTNAAGVSPRVDLDSRRPEEGELVVLPEAFEVDLLASVLLSGARGVLYLLAPPGLFGWSFLGDLKPPGDPTAIPLDSVGRPETFRTIDALGLTMWTNARGIADAGRRAEVAVEWLGTGTPVQFPAVPEKTVDIALIEANRWAGLAESVVEGIPEASLLRIGAIESTYSLCEALGPAHLLVWPSRIEGMSRIAREARAVGTVPVMLDTNPFVTREDYGEGIVHVPDLDAMADQARQLLDDPVRLRRLRAEAAASARLQTDWVGFADRLEKAVELTVRRPINPARQHLGDELRRCELARRLDEAGRTTAVRDGLVAELTGVQHELAAARTEATHLEKELAAVRTEAAGVEVELAGVRDKLAGVESVLQAQCARLVNRMIDRSGLGKLWVALRSR